MFTQKYQTQQKRLTTKYWIDDPGMYIVRVTPVGREDAAQKLMLGMSWIYPLSNGILHHYIFTISHL